MGRLLSEATGALARLDADALVELERRALDLKALMAGGAEVLALPELQARYRVFAAVVASTGENLGVLERVGARNPYGRARGSDPWVR